MFRPFQTALIGDFCLARFAGRGLAMAAGALAGFKRAMAAKKKRLRPICSIEFQFEI